MASTIFLNVDLDIQAKSGLRVLLQAFGEAVIVLNDECEDFADVELAEQPQSIDDAILKFYNIIHILPQNARAIWNNCETRSMNIGIQAGTTPYSEHFRISDKTISRLAEINAEIVMTVYAPSDQDNG